MDSHRSTQKAGPSSAGNQHANTEKPVYDGTRTFPLPRELRDRIYSTILTLPNCLISEEAAEEGFKKYNKSHCSRKSHTYPLELGGGSPFDLSLLLVSKIIYMEAYKVFYKVNTIYFKDTDILHCFLYNIGPARRLALTHVGFDWTGTDPKAAFRLLQSCANLKTVRCTYPISYPPGYKALREVRGLSNVMRLTKFIWNENYGRNVLQWCLEQDEDILQDDIDNEDDMDMASSKRAPSFVKLREGMMRSRSKTQEKSLEKMVAKMSVLG
ncbi:MAG: hypothetical protein Q9195_008864 [Heterodermia aff. obscurata]